MKWFLGAIAVLVLALVFRLGLLAYAMYALLGTMLMSRFLSWSWSEKLTAVRECNRLTAAVSENVAVVVTIENHGQLPVAWLLAEDLLPRHAVIYDPPNLRVTGRRLVLAMFRRHGSRTLFYQLTCNRRGYYQIGPLVLETGDLFGLHRRYRVASEPHFLMVYPPVRPLEGFDIASRRPIGEVRMSYRLFEDPTRIAGVRRYEAGDPLNRVHWRATARTGTLHSKVYEPSTVAGVTIVLDFHTRSFVSRHEPYRSELAITMAASLANAVSLMGQQLGLVTNARDAADRIRQEGWDFDFRSRKEAMASAGMRTASDRLRPMVIETRRGVAQFNRIRELLARAEMTDGLELPQLIRETSSRMPRDASVVVIVTEVTSAIAVALGNLRRQGFAVTAIVNTYEDRDYAAAAGMLLAERVEARHLRDESSVSNVCGTQLVR